MDGHDSAHLASISGSSGAGRRLRRGQGSGWPPGPFPELTPDPRPLLILRSRGREKRGASSQFHSKGAFPAPPRKAPVTLLEEDDAAAGATRTAPRPDGLVPAHAG